MYHALYSTQRGFQQLGYGFSKSYIVMLQWLGLLKNSENALHYSINRELVDHANIRAYRSIKLQLLDPSGADPGGEAGPYAHVSPPTKDAEVAFWSTALWLIHWLWNSSNKQLCLKCHKIRLAAGAGA